MKILLIGSGGREHALAWKMAQNKKVTKIYVAPGNAGTAIEHKCENVALHSNNEYVKFAKANKIDLTVVGPEIPLVDGVVDLFKKNKLKIFGPNKKAAQLEGSKVFAKKFMQKHNIPTAKFGSFTNPKSAIKYLKEKCDFPIVIKADGLAAGKGVEICPDLKSAINCINEFMVKNIFKTAGSKVVIEEFLEGPEASIICITDGNTIYPFISSKDHKQVFDNDKGPNTGGMGAICPNPYVTKSVLNDFVKQIMLPTLNGLKKDKIDFMGFIFFGIMITKKGPKLLEYNVRMGDPETESILPLLKNDLVDVFNKALSKKLKDVKLSWEKKASINVVLCSKGYPKKAETGKEIKIKKLKNSKIFFAGTKLENKKLITSGGRVLSVVSTGKTLSEATKKVYADIKNINFFGMHYRKDIDK